MNAATPALAPACVPSPENKRGERRRKVFHVARVDASPEVARCHILNLSQQGALIHCQLALSAMARVRLATDGFARDATVRWRAGSRIGIAFRLPLTEGELDALL